MSGGNHFVLTLHCSKCEGKPVIGTKCLCDSIPPLCPVYFFTLHLHGIYPLPLPNCSVSLCFSLMRTHVTLSWPLLLQAFPCWWAFWPSTDCSRVPLERYCVRAASSLPAGRWKWLFRQGCKKFYCASPKGMDVSWNGNAFITNLSESSNSASCSSLGRAGYLPVH